MLRWKKRKKERHYAQLHGLYDNNYPGRDALVIVAPLPSGRGYYWYGLGENTSHTPAATLEEAKAQALAHVRAQRAKGKP